MKITKPEPNEPFAMTLTDKARPDTSTKQRNNKFESVVSVVINTQSNCIQHTRVYFMNY